MLRILRPALQINIFHSCKPFSVLLENRAADGRSSGGTIFSTIPRSTLLYIPLRKSMLQFPLGVQPAFIITTGTDNLKPGIVNQNHEIASRNERYIEGSSSLVYHDTFQ